MPSCSTLGHLNYHDGSDTDEDRRHGNNPHLLSLSYICSNVINII